MIINAPQVALVFEGGGMRAAFSAGVLTELVLGEVFTGWVGGISAGSSCTVNYLARDLVRARRSFVEFAADPRFGGWRYFLTGRGMFHSDYIYYGTALPHQALPYPWDSFRANPTDFRIGGYRLSDGEMLYWGPDDIHKLPDLLCRVRASSTMPLLMPWTEVDGELYCDGALGPTGGFAHDAARAAGYEKLIVVFTRERDYVKPPMRFSGGYRALTRRYPALGDGLAARSANYNRSREELFELERAGDAFLVFPEEMPISNSERNVSKLTAVFEAGSRQGRELLPAIREFAGLA